MCIFLTYAPSHVEHDMAGWLLVSQAVKVLAANCLARLSLETPEKGGKYLDESYTSVLQRPISLNVLLALKSSNHQTIE